MKKISFTQNYHDKADRQSEIEVQSSRASEVRREVKKYREELKNGKNSGNEISQEKVEAFKKIANAARWVAEKTSCNFTYEITQKRGVIMLLTDDFEIEDKLTDSRVKTIYLRLIKTSSYHSLSPVWEQRCIKISFVYDL